jgi:hypothetical protein
VEGNLAMTPTEVNAVICALRNGGIAMVAVQNHTRGEVPRPFVLYHQGARLVEKLAKTVRAVFDLVQ